jgi:N-acetylglucosamine kinase-like BadF-type ATPase
MKQKYVIGVDGGNTKTHYALSDSEGNIVHFIEAGTASHERLRGYEGMKRELELRINQLLDESNINMEDVAFSVLGLAGADVRKQYEEISARLKEIGLVNFLVCNDAYLGVKAGSEKGYGICSINGTGTSCAGIDKYGRMLQVGGCGSYTGDDAGGGFITRRTIRLVYESIYKCGEPTKMKEMLFDILNIEDESLFLDAIYDQVLTGKTDRKQLSKLAFLAANDGDQVAMKLLQHVGRETAKAVIGAYRHLDFGEDEELEVILAGSIHVKGENPVMLETFKDEVTRNINGRIKFHLLEEPPATGAVIWALEELNGSIDGTVRKKVSEQLISLQKR